LDLTKAVLDIKWRGQSQLVSTALTGQIKNKIIDQ